MSQYTESIEYGEYSSPLLHYLNLTKLHFQNIILCKFYCVHSLTLTLSGPVKARRITEQRSYKPEIP